MCQHTPDRLIAHGVQTDGSIFLVSMPIFNHFTDRILELHANIPQNLEYGFKTLKQEASAYRQQGLIRRSYEILEIKVIHKVLQNQN